MAIDAAHLPTGFINANLAAIFLDEFVTNYEFARHQFEYKRKKYKKVGRKSQFVGVVTEWCNGDPWWWPKGNGQMPEDWGLASDDPQADADTLSQVLTSLGRGVSNFESGTRRAEAWKNFRG